MNLYLVRRTNDTRGKYDILLAAVVAATDESQAIELTTFKDPEKEHLTVEKIGEAIPGTEPGTILEDYRPG